MKIGVFVGSFNPVHKGHIQIANYIVDNNLVDKLFIIPTGNYWDKNDLIDVKDRINMLEFYRTDKIEINKDLNNLEYTYQVIDKLKERYPNDEFSLVLGADNIVSFDKWKNYEDLLKLELIIYTRNNIDIKYYLDKLGKYDKCVILNNVDSINISSTMIRENINDKELLEKYMDSFVIDYIVQNNLYGINNNNSIKL